MDKIVRSLRELPAPDTVPYEVGYGRPPVATRYKSGQSGNPKGRPKGAKNKPTPFGAERIKTLILEEAYREIPVLEQGRRVTIPVMTAVLRAVAMNAAKGNNRAATLLTTLVRTTEADDQRRASETFGAALSYKREWSEELARRKRKGNHPPRSCSPSR